MEPELEGWKEIEARYPSKCCECKRWLNIKDRCYFMRDGNGHGIIMCVPCNDMLFKQGMVGTPKSNPVINASEPSREDKIAKAHEENVEASHALCMAVRELTVAVNDRTRLLVKNMEAKA